MTAHNPVEVTGNIIVHHPTQQQASIECSGHEHIDCDGTAPAADLPGWWDPCTCTCHPAVAA